MGEYGNDIPSKQSWPPVKFSPVITCVEWPNKPQLPCGETIKTYL